MNKFNKLKTKYKVAIAGVISLGLITLAIYLMTPRIDVSASNKSIEEHTKRVKKNKKSDNSYIATINIKGKLKDVNIYDNATEETLFNKGAGIESDVSARSTPFLAKDYTFIKAHVENVFSNLDQVEVGDILELTLKNGKKYQYKANSKRDNLKYQEDNDKIYSSTNKVGISLSTCSKNSKDKFNPELVLVVNFELIK